MMRASFVAVRRWIILINLTADFEISLLEKAIVVNKGVLDLPQNRQIRPIRETLAAVRSFPAHWFCRCSAEALAPRENS